MARVTRVLHSNPVAPLSLGMRLAMALAVVAVTATFAPGMVAGIVHAASADKFNLIDDATLSQSFHGPEGNTKVSLEAHDIEVALDGSSARLVKRGGFLKATQTAERGPRRDVEIARGANGEPEYRYRVDGKAQAWCDDARRVIEAGFNGDKAYADRSSDHTTKPRAANTPPTGRKDWGAKIELTGSKDGVETYVRIHATGIVVDYDTGAIQLKPGAYLDIVERVGSSEKNLHVDEENRLVEGDLMPDEAVAWISDILRKHTTLPENVISTLSHE